MTEWNKGSDYKAILSSAQNYKCTKPLSLLPSSTDEILTLYRKLLKRLENVHLRPFLSICDPFAPYGFLAGQLLN